MMPHVPKLKEEGINLEDVMDRKLLALVVESPDCQCFVEYTPMGS